MRYRGLVRTVAALAAAFWLAAAPAARAGQMYPGDEVAKKLCAETLERIACKEDTNFSFLGMRGPRVFIFNGFYASKYSNFICTVTDQAVIIQNPEWLRIQRAVGYTVDPNTGCASGAYYNEMCSRPSEFECCPASRQQNKEEKKETEFWGKPVPGNLPSSEEMDKSGGKAGFWAKPLNERLEVIDQGAGAKPGE